MDITKHPNSHIVYVRRAPMFASSARKELDEYFAESYKAVGSYFSKGSTRTATGLTITEEDLLMPYILNIPKEDRDFRKEVNVWFQNIATKVPARDGVKLEIGLEKSNSEPVSENNKPINVEEYIRYKHIIGHPHVALNEEEGTGNQLKQYYIFDPEEVSLASIGINDQRDEALSKYLLIKDKPRSVRMYLTLTGIDVRAIRKGEEAMRLRDVADKSPNKFLAAYNDKDREIKYHIEDMIHYKILERIGSRIVTPEGVELGRDMKETVLYWKDTRNTKDVVMLKSRLQEAWKKESVSMDEEDLKEDRDLVGAESEKSAAINLDKSKGAGSGTTLDEV